MSRQKVAAVRIMMIHLITEIHECSAMVAVNVLYCRKESWILVNVKKMKGSP